jgi:hypothetical protein
MLYFNSFFSRGHCSSLADEQWVLNFVFLSPGLAGGLVGAGMMNEEQGAKGEEQNGAGIWDGVGSDVVTIPPSALFIITTLLLVLLLVLLLGAVGTAVGTAFGGAFGTAIDAVARGAASW